MTLPFKEGKGFIAHALPRRSKQKVWLNENRKNQALRK
jgi:hypothetical protein